MEPEFQAYIDFNNALGEIEFILNLAQSSNPVSKEYPTYNKAAMLLLVAKFESFVEQSLEEFGYNLSRAKVKTQCLPDRLKFHTLNHILDDGAIELLRYHKPGALEHIKEAYLYCEKAKSLERVRIDSRFDYGKHGPKMVIKLYQRIGIDDIFAECTVYEEYESLTEDKKKIDIVADLHSMTNYRNNILHEDASPNLTHDQIKAYKSHLLAFSKEVIGLLVARFQQIGAG